MYLLSQATAIAAAYGTLQWELYQVTCPVTCCVVLTPLLPALQQTEHGTCWPCRRIDGLQIGPHAKPGSL